MIVILVLACFLVCLTADWAIQRRRAPARAPGIARSIVAAVPVAAPAPVGCDRLPAALQHCARSQRGPLARNRADLRASRRSVGEAAQTETRPIRPDDLARHLTGRGGCTSSPALRERVGRCAAPARVHARGRDWLVTARVLHLDAFHDDLPGERIARRRTEDARTGLGTRLTALPGRVLRDGGGPLRGSIDLNVSGIPTRTRATSLVN